MPLNIININAISVNTIKYHGDQNQQFDGDLQLVELIYGG
jgi:hypothetical protein